MFDFAKDFAAGDARLLAEMEAEMPGVGEFYCVDLEGEAVGFVRLHQFGQWVIGKAYDVDRKFLRSFMDEANRWHCYPALQRIFLPLPKDDERCFSIRRQFQR